jgi:class 3 adenylate cyclase
MNIGDRINASNISGTGHQIGSRGNTYNVGTAAQSPAASAATADQNAPRHLLYAFADIVAYSKLSARLQKESQDYLLRLLTDGLAEAGVAPDQVIPQNQGDARLMGFPPATDAARVLAVLPRYLHDDLFVHNSDMAEHAQLRVRLSLVMGATAEGSLGLTGAAPIAVVRLGNAAVFRHVMYAAPRTQCGVIIDDHLHQQYVRQQFRADINPDHYAPVRVSDPDKEFVSAAWIRLFGYTSEQVAALIAQG